MTAQKKNLNAHYELLKNKWLKRHDTASKLLAEKHKEAFDYILKILPAKDKLAAGAASLILLSTNLTPVTAVAAMTGSTQPSVISEDFGRLDALVKDLKEFVPKEVRPLSADEEASISAKLSEHFRMKISEDINGLRLNRTYGVIGAEQHLMRYPGDNMRSHFTSQTDSDIFYSSGMAPGRGAWGYFANSGSEVTIQDIEREKWYIAVQTFAAPNYIERLGEYREFFKYRKMLVVNVDTGQAIVADVADAGPAIWTGKHLGGSPEVMYYLGLADGMRKGPVLYFFINDQGDTIPLGPITLR